MKVICIDDSHKPNDVKSTDWVVKGKEYTVLNEITSKLTGDKYYVLEEISISNPLYGGYNVKRFGIDISYILDAVKEEELEGVLFE